MQQPVSMHGHQGSHQCACVRTDGSLVGIEQVPALTLNIGNYSTNSPCANAPIQLTKLSDVMSQLPVVNGLYHLNVLWQNNASFGFQECVSNLSRMTSIDIAPYNPKNYSLSLQVSFCLANVTILPSTLISEGKQLAICLKFLG